MIGWIQKKRLMNKKGVHGFCEHNGKLEVWVEKKLPLETLNKMVANKKVDFWEKDIIPRTYRTGLFKVMATDVVEMKPFKAELPKPSKNEIKSKTLAQTNIDHAKYRPLMGGVEIAPTSMKWMGTLGFHVQRTVVKLRGIEKELWNVPNWMVEKLGGDAVTKIYGVTNRHVVLSNYNQAQVGQVMVQPWGDSEHVYKVAKVGSKYLDCALLECLGVAKKEIVKIGTIKGVKDAEVGMKVQKKGRTTSYTTGTCVRTNVTSQIDYGTVVLTLSGLDMYTDMGNPGDSGSLICDLAGNAVTLLNSGNSINTMGIPIRKVLKELQIDL